MATSSWKSCSSFEGYYSSTSWLKNQNCYCDPLWIYGYLPTSVGQTTGRTIEIDVPLLYSYSASATYEAYLWVSGGSQGVSASGSVSLTVNDVWKRFTFYNVTADSGAYYEVKIEFSRGAVQCYTSNGKWPEARVTYTAVTSCVAPTSIWGSSDRVIPGKSYTFSWDGASSGVSNAISDYRVAYRYGNGDWTYDSTTSTSYSFAPSASYRGSTLQFAVQARGTAGESYYSSWAYSEYYTINSLPPTPTVSKNPSYYSYDSGGDITFTASVGADAQGDEVSIWYSTDPNFSSETRYTGSFTKNFSSNNSSVTYYFRSWDTHEVSSTIPITVYRNTPPTINSLGLSYSSLPGKLSGETYVRSISTSPKVSESVSYTWKLYYNSTKSTSGASSVDLGTSANNTFDLTNYKGKYIYLQLTVNDEYDTREAKSQWFLVPTDLSSVTDVSITNGDGKNLVEPIGNDLYTINNIYINWSLPEVTDTQLSRYSYVELQKWNGSSWSWIKTYPTKASTTAAQSYTEKYTLPSDIGYDTVYRIIVYTKEDSPGTQSAGYVYTSKTLRRAPKPKLASVGSSLVVEPSIIRPTSGNTGALGETSSGSKLIFKHSVENTVPDLGAKWTLTATVNEKSITLMDKKKVDDTVDGITSETADSIITHTFTNAKWVSLFSQPTWNNIYDAKITLSLENDLGEVSEAVATTTLAVDYREPAYWTNADSRFTEKIKYTNELIGSELTTAGSTSNNSAFLVNAGEKVQLTIPSITDLNNDMDKTVYVEVGIADWWSNDLNVIKKVTNWNKAGSFKPSSSTTFEYTIPNISEDIFYVFRAYIQGKNTLDSREYYVANNQQYVYSPTVVRACKSEKPSIEFAKVADGNSNGVFTIIPKITLNGSDDYSTYKNWERAGILSGYPTKNITVTAVVCTDGLFDSDNEATCLTETILEKYSEDYSSVNSATFETITKADFKNQTLFIKLYMTLNTGFGTILESESSVYTFYATAPTVSHRSHQVGINTNKFDATDILHISAQSEKNILRFTGDNAGLLTWLKLDLSSLALSASDCLDLQSPLKAFTIKDDNPYIAFADTGSSDSRERYIQVYNNQIGIGAGWASSIKVDDSGNLTVVGAIDGATIDGGTW